MFVCKAIGRTKVGKWKPTKPDLCCLYGPAKNIDPTAPLPGEQRGERLLMDSEQFVCWCRITSDQTCNLPFCKCSQHPSWRVIAASATGIVIWSHFSHFSPDGRRSFITYTPTGTFRKITIFRKLKDFDEKIIVVKLIAGHYGLHMSSLLKNAVYIYV